MIDVKSPSCATCVYLFVEGDRSICRRYPPVPLVLAAPGTTEVMIHSSFPPMLASGWCGEHQGRQ